MTQTVKPVATRATPIDRTTIRDVAPIRTAWKTPARYGLAIVLTLVSFGLTLLIHDYMGRTLFALFWPAILVIAWFGGLGPAILAALLAITLVDYSLIPPAGLSLDSGDDVITLTHSSSRSPPRLALGRAV